MKMPANYKMTFDFLALKKEIDGVYNDLWAMQCQGLGAKDVLDSFCAFHERYLKHAAIIMKETSEWIENANQDPKANNSKKSKG